VVAIPLVVAHHIGGVYLAFLALVLLASFEAVQPLAPALQSLGRKLTAGRRVFEALDTTPEVTDPTRPEPVAALIRRVAPSLAFEHVSFAYGDVGEAAVHDITLCIPPGRRVAIVGPSGAGKSTLARLAARCHDPIAGAVLLDGVDIRRHTLGDLRAAVRLSEQDAYVFNATIRGNLRLVRPDATDDDLLRALEVAQLGDFMRALPDGLGTWVGEQGLRLSGGERQRLALARALLTDAPLLIVDEPTANLDPATEAALLDALDAYTRGRTLLLLTHRLVRMERMDEVVVLDGGRVAERGMHTSLLAAGGLYRRMFDIQQDIVTLSAALE
jgi:ATP-binding cassette subfamily C protein CydC